MSEVQPTTTTNTLPAPLQPMREQLPVMLEKYLPKLEKQKANADAALDEIQPITNKDEAEDAIATLAAVRDVYQSNQKLRKEMTDITDAFKDIMMEYERDFNPETKAKSKYNEKRKLVEAWQQEEHDRIQREKQELAKKKELENLKVDLRAQIMKNLNDNVIDTVKKADDYARQLFATLEPENFDTHAETFKKQKPKLKIETYDNCFKVPDHLMAKAKELLAAGDFSTFVKEMQQEETYNKWNSAIQEAVAPVLNEWRARIPDLKAECLKKASASAEEQQRLEADRKKRDEQEQQQRQHQLDLQQKQSEMKIQEQANLDKMSNEFASQASSQEMDDAGKTKLVLKFADAAKAPKAFMEIVLHCMRNPEFAAQFPGFQKRDHKTKKLMFDDKQRPVYIPMVQEWIDWFLANCDGQPEGVVIEHDSKVTIRK